MKAFRTLLKWFLIYVLVYNVGRIISMIWDRHPMVILIAVGYVIFLTVLLMTLAVATEGDDE